LIRPSSERLFAAIRSVVVGAALIGLCGCGGDEDPSLMGTWTGAFKDSKGGLGGGSITFHQQAGSTLHGTWQVFFQLVGISAGFNNNGMVSGMAEGSSISGALTSQGPCPFAMKANVSGKTMTGTYTTGPDCSFTETGSFDLEKQ
jgi:hypothetical protein